MVNCTCDKGLRLFSQQNPASVHMNHLPFLFWKGNCKISLLYLTFYFSSCQCIYPLI